MFTRYDTKGDKLILMMRSNLRKTFKLY